MKAKQYDSNPLFRQISRMLIVVILSVLPFSFAMASEDVHVEQWMTVPFETGIQEEEFTAEQWMIQPFEAGIELEISFIEPWMTQPFYNQEEEKSLAAE